MPEEREKSRMELILEDLFGAYEPIERERVSTETRETTRADAEGGVTTETVLVEHKETVREFNWSWAAGVLLFGLVLYCTLRMIGGLMKWSP